MQSKILRFLHDNEGGTAAEYVILASLIAAVIVAAVTALGLATNDLFGSANNEFKNY